MNDIAIMALREMLDRLLETTPYYPPSKTILPDKWLAASGLQKGVRRGNISLVLTALETLWNIDPRYARRRLATIAFEDVGLGAPDIVAVTAMVCSGTKYLPKEKIYPSLYSCAIALTNSPKSRSSEHIYTTLSFSNNFDPIRDRYFHKTPHQLIDILIDKDRYLLERSVAGWYLAGTKRFVGGMMYAMEGALPLFEWAIEQLDIDPWQVLMTLAGIRVTQCALPIYWPLMLSQKECKEGSIRKVSFNSDCEGQKIPPYILDQFTRGGKTVIRNYLKEDNNITRWLNKKLPSKAWDYTLEMGIFHISSSELDKEFIFTGSDKLKNLSIEADCCKEGLLSSDLGTFLNLISNEIGEINNRRSEYICEAFG